MKQAQVQELLLQAIETELGGRKVYEKAIECAVNPELREEWQKYLAETRNHADILNNVFARLKLDPKQMSPGRQIVQSKAMALVQSMDEALKAGDKKVAQIVAAEAVVEAETKDHQNWELIGVLAETTNGEMAEALMTAYKEVEDQEDEHLYHTMGWARELWLESLGLPAELPPPEEAKKIKTAIAAARARNERVKAVAEG